MENLIGAAVLVVLVGGAVAYLIRAKRRGVKCVGVLLEAHVITARK